MVLKAHKPQLWAWWWEKGGELCSFSPSLWSMNDDDYIDIKLRLPPQIIGYVARVINDFSTTGPPLKEPLSETERKKDEKK